MRYSLLKSEKETIFQSPKLKIKIAINNRDPSSYADI
jgi:hypothetical protein